MFEGSFDLTAVVNDHYGDVYRFALSLGHDEAEASDLTQEAFWRLAEKGRQLRDPRKVKSWLFTTLHREFIGRRRHANQFPQADLEACEGELPVVSPNVMETLDGRTVLEALSQVDELFRAPLVLFYLEDYSYAEIAKILDVPVGTIMSRLSRGKIRLKQLLTDRAAEPEGAPLLRFPRRAA